MSIELPVTTRHRRDMIEKLLKATLNPNSHTVRRIIAIEGFDLIIVYLDESLIISAQALTTLIHLLRKLVSLFIEARWWITFLGIELNSIDMTLRLPQDKLGLLRQELQSFHNRKRVPKRQLQSLAWSLVLLEAAECFSAVFSTKLLCYGMDPIVLSYRLTSAMVVSLQANL